MFCSTFSTSQITNSSKSEGNRSLLYRTFADFFPQTRVFLYVSLMSPEGSAMGGGGAHSAQFCVLLSLTRRVRAVRGRTHAAKND